METEIIETFEGFSEFVNNLPFEFCLSRGQSCDKPLLPTGLRKDDSGNRLFSKATIDSFLEDFETNAVHFMDNSSEVSNNLEWQVYAQHFGLPTRLLDFTYSHIISLMFAVENAFQYNNDEDLYAVVWFLNPYELNEVNLKRRHIVNISFFDSTCLDSVTSPVAISSKKTNSRIAAQNGVFVLFQDDNESLESLESIQQALRKVLIPYKSAKSIMRTLYLMGMRFSNLYPELASVSKDIMLKEDVKKYIQNREDNNE